jgi:hypothetical protein
MMLGTDARKGRGEVGARARRKKKTPQRTLSLSSTRVFEPFLSTPVARERVREKAWAIRAWL